MTGIITTKEELKETLTEMLPDAIIKASKCNPEKLFTVTETAKKLEKAYTTVRRMIDQERIKTTADGKYVSQKAIDDYLTGTQ